MGVSIPSRTYGGSKYLDWLLGRMINAYLGKYTLTPEIIEAGDRMGLDAEMLKERIKRGWADDERSYRVMEDAFSLFAYSMYENAFVVVDPIIVDDLNGTIPSSFILLSVKSDDRSHAICAFSLRNHIFSLIDSADRLNNEESDIKALEREMLERKLITVQHTPGLKREMIDREMIVDEDFRIFDCFIDDSGMLFDGGAEYLMKLSDDEDSPVCLFSSGGSIADTGEYSLNHLFDNGIIEYEDPGYLDQAFDFFGIKPNYKVMIKMFGVE